MIKETLLLLTITCISQPGNDKFIPKNYSTLNKTELLTNSDQNSPFQERVENDLQAAFSGSVALLEGSRSFQLQEEALYLHSQNEYTAVSTYIKCLDDQED